ncbi:MAG: protein-L-isoaspartate O-methyltransferase [Thermoplasmata archaeon]|nr:MAG: protein-L-isoaspartate O-methyltransferase [Thermoplasmata archaeon]
MERFEERRRLIENLKRLGYIRSKKVEDAMMSIRREDFVPQGLREYAYHDTPLEIGHGQTISAPHMVALMCEELELERGLKVLEVGAGSGYHSAVISRIIGEEGMVYSIERIPDLVEFARRNLERAGIRNVEVVEGDGSMGLPEHAPYDRILVTCSAPDIPDPLVEQLKDGGIILIPVGRTFSVLVKGLKRGNKVVRKEICGCAFVPLIGKYGF